MIKIRKGSFVKSSDSTLRIMIRLLISLIPIIAFAIYKNVYLVYKYSKLSMLESLHPVFIMIVSVLVSYITEVLWFKFIKKNDFKESLINSLKSYSIIPGIFLALVLPVNTPLLLVAFGSFISIVIGKLIYGGFGNNIFNPALIGYLFIAVCYGSLMGSYLNGYELDTIAGSTPLTNFSGNYLGSYDTLVGPYKSLVSMFIGFIPGALGEVSKALILLAFIYLTITKTIKWRIPTCYVLTVFTLTLVIGLLNGVGIYYPLFHILSGGLLFGAVFMSTDPVTSPKANAGQIFYGISLGILTVFIRYLTNYPEGVMTSILVMNMFVPIFDRLGDKLRHSTKSLIITIIIFILLCTGLVLKINSTFNSEVEDNNVEIVEKIVDKDSTTYKVTSKAFGVIKADVVVKNKKIISIDVTDSSSETQWKEIEKANYIDKVISNQSDIDKLDTIAGSTYSSNSLKEIVKSIIKEESK